MYKCHFCAVCTGRGCIGEMPGMGGPNESRNVIVNVSDWDACAKEKAGLLQNQPVPIPIRLAPITGAEENIGYANERQFYVDMVSACAKGNIPICIGDGTPDYKLQYGIEAVKAAGKKAGVFIKPYPQEVFFERLEWAGEISELCGVDIDSYNIVTMRNLVHLEKKTAGQLLDIKKWLSKRGLPFAIKGIFTKEDLDLVRAVKPDIAFVSNHGGRVDTRTGSTADFLARYAAELKAQCAELWVDGGIRTGEHVKAAALLGADCVLVGRPLITALCKGGESCVQEIYTLLRYGTPARGGE